MHKVLLEEGATVVKVLHINTYTQCWHYPLQTAGGMSEGVEVALDPSELDLDTATMTAR